MTGLLILFAVSVLLEFVLHLPWLRKLRLELGLLAALTAAAASAGFVLWHLQLFTLLFALLSAYRVFNMARIVRGRMNEPYLRRATVTTSLMLFFLQDAALLAALAWDVWGTTGHALWTLATGLQLAVAAGSLVSLARNLKRTRWPSKTTRYADAELPSLSVAVPARNETDDLRACLQSILATDYPKLEVLVYDDCSQTKKTPEIIRSFAQSGVRFLSGDEPSEDWLPKNYAYNKLAEEASGDYILFCGVDMRFDASSFRQVVSLMLDRRKTMLSVVPRRAPQAYGKAALIQAMRYWWELVPPRRYFNRPPVLSSCWVMQRKALQATGGFKATRRAITPEAYFAQRAVHENDGYSFLRAGQAQGVTSIKTIAQQRDTAVRVRYPQVHRRPEQVAVQSLLEAGFLLAPFVLAVGGFWVSIGTAAHILAVLACICIVTIHELVALTTYVSKWWFGLVAPPLMILSDIALLHYSMWKYEFSTVLWKGRNVCLPAMHVTRHLPKF